MRTNIYSVKRMSTVLFPVLALCIFEVLLFILRYYDKFKLYYVFPRSLARSHWPFGDIYCTINNFVANVTVAASVFTLVAISFDR